MVFIPQIIKTPLEHECFHFFGDVLRIKKGNLANVFFFQVKKIVYQENSGMM